MIWSKKNNEKDEVNATKEALRDKMDEVQDRLKINKVKMNAGVYSTEVLEDVIDGLTESWKSAKKYANKKELSKVSKEFLTISLESFNIFLETLKEKTLKK